MPRAPKRRWFLDDGYYRAQVAAAAEIRAQVVAEYSERLAAAGLWASFWLWQEIKREIRSRVDKKAPPYGRY
jgi:hypothetical protein